MKTITFSEVEIENIKGAIESRIMALESMIVAPEFQPSIDEQINRLNDILEKL